MTGSSAADWAKRDAARGQAVVVSGARGEGEVVFIGFAPTFRAYRSTTSA